MKTKIVISVQDDENLAMLDLYSRPFFEEKSLLEICVEKMKKLGLPIVVNSANQRYLELAKQLGVTPQVRPGILDYAETTPAELSKHFAKENDDAEMIMIVHCGNPLISLEHYKVAISIPPEKWGAFDSIVSGKALKKYVWKNESATERRPLYNVEDRMPVERIRNLTAIEGSISLITRKRMIEVSDFIGRSPVFVMIPKEEIVEIESEIDFAVAKVRYDDQQKRRQNAFARVRKLLTSTPRE